MPELGMSGSAGGPGWGTTQVYPTERLGLLVDRETEARDSRRLALRLKAAKLRQEASVEDIDFRTPRGLDRSVIMSLAQAGWVTAHHNLLVTGPTDIPAHYLSFSISLGK